MGQIVVGRPLVVVRNAGHGAVIDLQLSDCVESLPRYALSKGLQGMKVVKHECVAGIQQIDRFRVDLATRHEQRIAIRWESLRADDFVCDFEMFLIHRKVAVNVESCDDFPGYGDEAKSIIANDVRVDEYPQFNRKPLKKQRITVGITIDCEFRQLPSQRFRL